MSSSGESSPPIPPPDEQAIKAAELRARALEAERALAAARAPWWRRADPLVVAVVVGALSLVGNAVVTLLSSYSNVAQERQKAGDDLALEKLKAQYNLVLQAMATNDPEAAKRNINFFIDAGLLVDDDCKIRKAIDKDQPVLPSLSGVAPAATGTSSGHYAPEIAQIYDFPPNLDGRDQTIGIIELAGALNMSDLKQYFGALSLPVPDVASIAVDSAQAQAGDADGQVMLDVEVAGAVAPRAHLRVYFAPNTAVGYADALHRAVADDVDIISTGWGEPETGWKPGEISTINAALKSAADHNITVLAAAGDNGVTDGVNDGLRHVDFPASSPWVLAVGGTSLQASADVITSETVWQDGDSATGGGVSTVFDRPDWQANVPVPKRPDGTYGRGIPDIVATASPEFGMATVVDGHTVVEGGDSATAPLWAGLIALIDQGVGHPVGYINPRLYEQIGPAGVFHTITTGNNGDSGVTGYSAGPGWSPVAGWGSPDGQKLLTWFLDHPDPRFASEAKPCEASAPG
jgi:kumamolisin